jgi:hypothetical protein
VSRRATEPFRRSFRSTLREGVSRLAATAIIVAPSVTSAQPPPSGPPAANAITPDSKALGSDQGAGRAASPVANYDQDRYVPASFVRLRMNRPGALWALKRQKEPQSPETIDKARLLSHDHSGP